MVAAWRGPPIDGQLGRGIFWRANSVAKCSCLVCSGAWEGLESGIQAVRLAALTQFVWREWSARSGKCGNDTSLPEYQRIADTLKCLAAPKKRSRRASQKPLS